MSHLNRSSIIGVIDEAPELLENSKGKNFIRLRIKSVETYKKDGESKSHATWHDIEYWGHNAKNLFPRLAKGLRCWVEGKAKVRLYTAKSDQKMTFHYIQSNTLELLKEE